jgi:putative nucleotidyltransferase with HDIG domain
MDSGFGIENPSGIYFQIQNLKTLLRFDRELTVRKEKLNAPPFPVQSNRPSQKGQPYKFIRLISAKRILRDLNRTFELLSAAQPKLIRKNTLDKSDDLKACLLHFIAVTDGSEDTYGHSQFVAAYSLLLAKAVGIDDPRRLADVECGALLHDIGKIGIPDSILKKPGSLSAVEKDIVKEHPVIGYEIIQEFGFLKRAARVVLHHHERYDGLGYPDGLAGEHVPLEARIFSIVDAVDAITSDRPYRKGRGFEDAFREIERCGGSQFDPLLVKVLLSIPKERWRQARMNTLRYLTRPTIH